MVTKHKADQDFVNILNQISRIYGITITCDEYSITGDLPNVNIVLYGSTQYIITIQTVNNLMVFNILDTSNKVLLNKNKLELNEESMNLIWGELIKFIFIHNGSNQYIESVYLKDEVNNLSISTASTEVMYKDKQNALNYKISKAEVGSYLYEFYNDIKNSNDQTWDVISRTNKLKAKK